MDKNLKAIFDDVCSDLSINKDLMKRLTVYKTKFINRNTDHIEFFGGNLMGVQIVRFVPADRNAWFNDVLQCLEIDLEDRIHSLDSINADFAVSSDIMNLSTLWLTYAINRSTILNAKEKHQAMHDVMMILNIKLITSLLYNYFKYPADEAVAKATYNELSYRFTIKQEGSWYRVLEQRSEDILDVKGIHHSVLTKFDDDNAVVYTINDIQGRLRDMIKNIYAVFMRVHEQGTRVASSSSMIEMDGVETLKDKTKSLTMYTTYILAVLPDRDTLKKEDLMQVIERMMKTMPPKLFRETLDWMSDNCKGTHTQLIEETINGLMIHAFDYLSANRSLMRNTADIAGLLTRLKGTYMSSRNTDGDLKKVRTNFEKIAKLATGNKNNNILSSLRTGVMLYLVVRAIAMKHYTN